MLVSEEISKISNQVRIENQILQPQTWYLSLIASLEEIWASLKDQLSSVLFIQQVVFDFEIRICWLRRPLSLSFL